MEIVRIFKALGDEARLRLLNLVSRHELSVGELVGILGMGQSRVSRHLKILSDCGLIVPRRDGSWVFYSASAEGPGPGLLEACQGYISDPVFSEDLSRAAEAIRERDRQSRIFFNSVASDYNNLSAEIMGGLDAASLIAPYLGSPEVAVDLGCGPGGLLPLLSSRAARVIGVDASPRMLEEARRRFPGDGVSLRMGELEHLPLRDAEADFAVASLALHHLSNPLEGIREIYRALALGGKFVVLDFFKHDSEEMRRKFGDRWLGFEPAQMRSWLLSSGFKIVEEKEFEAGRGLRLGLYLAEK